MLEIKQLDFISGLTDQYYTCWLWENYELKCFTILLLSSFWGFTNVTTLLLLDYWLVAFCGEFRGKFFQEP